KELFDDIRKQGFVRVRVDGEVYDLNQVPTLNRRQNHDIAVVVDRLIVRPADRTRLNDSIETALKAAEGVVEVVRHGETEDGRRDLAPSPVPRLPSPRFSANASPARSAVSPCQNSSLASSPSTRRSALVPSVTGSGLGVKSMKIWSWAIPASRSSKEWYCL